MFCCCCCCKAEFNFSKLPSATGCKELEIEMPFLILFTGRNSAGEDSVALDCLFLSFFFFFPAPNPMIQIRCGSFAFFCFLEPPLILPSVFIIVVIISGQSYFSLSFSACTLKWSWRIESNRITRWPSPSPENCAYCASLAFDILSFSPVVVVVIYCPLPLGYTLNIRQIWWKLERAREAINQSPPDSCRLANFLPFWLSALLCFFLPLLMNATDFPLFFSSPPLLMLTQICFAAAASAPICLSLSRRRFCSFFSSSSSSRLSSSIRIRRRRRTVQTFCRF